MAKSKVRGGVKAHKAKVEMRNQKLKSTQSVMEKLFKESMQKEIEALKAKNEIDALKGGETPTENTEQ